MIDQLADPVVAGGTAAILLKGLNLLELVVAKRRHERNGNGNGFSKADHDTLSLAADRQVRFYDGMQKGLERLHNDMEDVKRLLARS